MNSTATTFSASRFVEDVRTLAPVAGRVAHDWLPDGRTTLVLRVFEDGRGGDLCAGGPRSRALFKNASGVVRATSVRLKPGWSASLLGVAADELTDRIVPLEDIWGREGGDLCRDLLDARSPREVLDLLERALVLRAQQTFESASARLSRQAIRLLEGGEEVRVSRVAERLGVTARHLHRVFTASVGVGPKDFARAARLQRAVRMAAVSNDWSRIAADAGYYDQAHLIADFRELVGLTPSAYVKRAAGQRPT